MNECSLLMNLLNKFEQNDQINAFREHDIIFNQLDNTVKLGKSRLQLF